MLTQNKAFQSTLSEKPSHIQHTEVIDRHAPLKSKTIYCNQAPFMTKELSKAIMTKSRLRNIYNHNKPAENWELLRRQRNLCVTLPRKSVRNYFAGIS